MMGVAMAKKDVSLQAGDTLDKKTKSSGKSSGNAKNSKSKKKPNLFKKIGNWFHDLRVEFKKVIWPDKKTVATQTSVVLVTIILFSVFIGLLDEGLLKLMELLLKLGQ